MIHVDLTDSRRLGDPDLEEAGGDTVAAHMLNMLRDMRTRSDSLKSKQDYKISLLSLFRLDRQLASKYTPRPEPGFSNLSPFRPSGEVMIQ